MPVLTPGTPLATSKPMLLVENKLAAGSAVFTLVVADQDGNLSAPAQLKVTILPRQGTPMRAPAAAEAKPARNRSTTQPSRRRRPKKT
jgi:hypothetical protein